MDNSVAKNEVMYIENNERTYKMMHLRKLPKVSVNPLALKISL